MSTSTQDRASPFGFKHPSPPPPSFLTSGTYCAVCLDSSEFTSTLQAPVVRIGPLCCYLSSLLHRVYVLPIHPGLAILELSVSLHLSVISPLYLGSLPWTCSPPSPLTPVQLLCCAQSLLKCSKNQNPALLHLP